VAVEKASPTALASAPLTWSMPGPPPRGVPDAPGGTVTGTPPPPEEGNAVAGATALGGADEAGAGGAAGGVLHPAHTITTAVASTVLPIWRITVLLIAVHLSYRAVE